MERVRALGIGWILALLVFILVIVFWGVGKMPAIEALLFALLAAAIVL